MLKKGICSLLSFLMVMTCLFPAGLYGSSRTATAKELRGEEPQAATGTALDSAVPSQSNLRLIFTTDIHGQVLNYNYQTGKSLNRGLNKVYTMIQSARSEVGNNALTFDLGDSVMDFNSDYIYSQDAESVQPVYKAMAMINYDAITLGNHDFDFGYDYIVNQLELSGLMEKCVLANVHSTINGNSVFGVENKIIEKQLQSGLTVKIGIIGETTPSLSTRTEGYKNKLVTEDIVENAERQAAELKKQGADIVVVLAHSGFGTQTPSKKSADTAYALTKLDDVNVVLAGHDHIDFPVKDSSDVHYTLPNVDRATGLVNGKRLVMIRDSCRGIGVVDLNLKRDDSGKIVVDNSSYEIRKTTETTEANQDISNTMSAWDAKLKKYCQNKVGNIADGQRWNNYDALLESNEVVQTVHNAQLDYASNYIANNAPEYKNYPIVSITRYTKYGSDSGADFADLSGTVVEGNADSFANYHRYVYIYKVTGQQLKEWLEWSASIYQTINTSSQVNWNNIFLSDYIKKEGGNSLVQEEFISEWNRFFQFEGVEYKIDLSAAPRYDYDGNKINNTNRIKDFTRNGVPISDEDSFVLVTDKIVSNVQSEANEGIVQNVISKSHVILQDIVFAYLARKALLGNLEVTVSRNWELLLPDNYKFMLVTGAGAGDEILKKEWCEGLYGNLGETNYYKCKYKSSDSADTDAPSVVLSPDNTAETNSSVNISVIASDKSSIKTMKYAYGVFNSKDDAVWTTAATDGAINIENNVFTATKSGVYSVYVEDEADNVSIEKIAITNINPEILVKPIVNKVDNKDTKVTGKAEPNVSIYVTIGEYLYDGTVGVDGSFSVTIPPQKAEKKLYVYVEDDSGRTSNTTAVVVKRVGPNCPTIKSAKNNGITIDGATNDSNVKIFAIIDEKVYVSKSLGTSYYTECKKYDDSLTVKTTNITIKSNGTYSVTIPNQYAGTEVRVFSVDKLGRVSHVRKRAITKAAPNRATLYEISDVERYIYGYVPDGNGCSVELNIDNRVYDAIADEEGYFAAPVGVLSAGDAVIAYAYDDTGSTVKNGYPSTYLVQSAEDMYEERREVGIHINKVTDKDREISGKWTEPDSKIYVCAGNREYITTTDGSGRYSVDIRARLRIDSTVYVLSRSTKGSIKGMRRFNVVEGAPIAPVVVGVIKTTTEYVKAYTKENCTLTLKIGSKKYVQNSGVYDSSTNRYYYTFSVTRPRAMANVQAFAQNNAGITKSNVKTVRKVKVKNKEKKI